MIRPLTCVCMLLAAGSGMYVYQTKHRAQMLDREIARTYKQIETTRERITALKGEWAGLNETERLADLAQQHLALKALDPKQFVAMADLASRLPMPLPPGSAMTAAAETPAPAAPAATAPTASAPVAAAKPAPVAVAAAAPRPTAPSTQILPPAPAQIAAAAAVPAKPVQHASVAPLPASAPPAPNAAVSARQAAPAAAPTVAAATPRFMAPVVNVSASPMSAPQPIHQAVAQTLSQPASSAPGIGESVARATQGRPAATAMATNLPPPQISSALGSSALGGARTALPAPVPYGSSAAAR
jgi:hypothetical protein